MQANRNALMDSCIVSLESQIGPAFAKVDAYVTQILGSQWTAVTLPVPLATKVSGVGKAR